MEDETLSPGLWGDHDGLRKDIAAFRQQIQEAGLDVGLAGTLESYADDAEVAFGERNYYGKGGVRELLDQGRAELQRVMLHSAVPLSLATPASPPLALTAPVRPSVAPLADIEAESPTSSRWMWIVVACGVVTLLAALTHGFGLFNALAPVAGSGVSAQPFQPMAPVPGEEDGPAPPAQDLPTFSQAQILQMAGLPSSYRFLRTNGNTTLQDLRPGQVDWTMPTMTGRQGGHNFIRMDAPLADNVAVNGYGPGGAFVLLVANTGHSIKLVYFPACDGSSQPLSTDPPVDVSWPVDSIKIVPSVCS